MSHYEEPLLDECALPGCRGELRPHCGLTTCDIVVCTRCSARGTLDGEGWARRPQTFRELSRVTDQLYRDLEVVS
jgi:hypothetical protein